MYLESRESPTTIWRLDPIVAAAISSGVMGQLTRQLPSWTAERYGISFPGTSGTGNRAPGHWQEDGSTRVILQQAATLPP